MIKYIKILGLFIFLFIFYSIFIIFLGHTLTDFFYNDQWLTNIILTAFPPLFLILMIIFYYENIFPKKKILKWILVLLLLITFPIPSSSYDNQYKITIKIWGYSPYSLLFENPYNNSEIVSDEGRINMPHYVGLKYIFQPRYYSQIIQEVSIIILPFLIFILYKKHFFLKIKK